MIAGVTYDVIFDAVKAVVMRRLLSRMYSLVVWSIPTFWRAKINSRVLWKTAFFIVNCVS